MMMIVIVLVMNTIRKNKDKQTGLGQNKQGKINLKDK